MKVFVEEITPCLELILRWSKSHKVDAAKFQFKKHCCGIRYDPCNVFIYLWPAFKIVIKRFKNYFLAGNPFLEFERACSYWISAVIFIS